jgi:serine protease Do
MMIRLFFIVLLLFPLKAFAEGPIVPSSQAQIQYSYAPIVKKVSPAVVNIYTKRVITRQVNPFMSDPIFQYFFGNNFNFDRGLNRQRIESALGSGVIVNPEGLIVTNAHVISEADEITVVLPDGREFEADKVLVDKPTDLALLRISNSQEDLPYVSLRPSETLEVGDLVLAIGNPFGVGQTVTGGIVSALARSSLDINDFNFFIQTDAAINPGNSGGALVAMDGGVVGINTAIYSRHGGSMGLGFAIPSEMVAAVIAAEKAGNSGAAGIVRPWLGISAQKVTQDIAENLSLETVSGALVSALHSVSPAKKAGIKIGDVVLSIDGKSVRDPSEMKFRMATVPLGSKTVFEIFRSGKAIKLKVEALAPPENPPRDKTELRGYHPLNGAIVANINPALSVELGIEEERGVIILQATRGSPSSRIVGQGDIIVSVNGQSIDNVKSLNTILDKQSGGWELTISRNGRSRTVLIR